MSSHIKNLFFKGSSVVCVAIIGITSFTGCDTPLFGNGHYISASPFPIDKVTNIQGEGIADTLDSQLIDKAKRNFDEIDSVNKQERPWTHAHERPKLCLALSGGGIRSAAFSLGVMKGLSELRLKEGILYSTGLILYPQHQAEHMPWGGTTLSAKGFPPRITQRFWVPSWAP